jgi:hypothetical protein
LNADNCECECGKAFERLNLAKQMISRKGAKAGEVKEARGKVKAKAIGEWSSIDELKARLTENEIFKSTK